MYSYLSTRIAEKQYNVLGTVYCLVRGKIIYYSIVRTQFEFWRERKNCKINIRV